MQIDRVGPCEITQSSVLGEFDGEANMAEGVVDEDGEELDVGLSALLGDADSEGEVGGVGSSVMLGDADGVAKGASVGLAFVGLCDGMSDGIMEIDGPGL
jgi:hypothetical protein